MNTKTIVVIALFMFWVVACALNYGSSDYLSDRSSSDRKPGLDLNATRKIARGQLGFDVGYSVALLPEGDIWATGGWNTRGNILYRWTNEDKEWHPQRLPVGQGSVMAKVYFTNSQNGWLIGETTIQRTRDGGQTWEQVQVPKNSEISRFQTVRFIDSGSGFLGGTTGYMDKSNFEPKHGIEILCAKNDGLDFDICHKDAEHTTILGIVSTEQATFALVDGNEMLVTQDRGRLWVEKKLPISANAITRGIKDVVWIVGNKGQILYSNDRADSWIGPKLPATDFGGVDWNSIAFRDDGFGIAVGTGGAIIVSENGGVWAKSATDRIDEDLFDVQVGQSSVLIQGKDNIYIIPFR